MFPRTIDRLWVSRVRGFFGFRITVGFLFLSLGSSKSVSVLAFCFYLFFFFSFFLTFFHVFGPGGFI